MVLIGCASVQLTMKNGVPPISSSCLLILGFPLQSYAHSIAFRSSSSALLWPACLQAATSFPVPLSASSVAVNRRELLLRGRSPRVGLLEFACIGFCCCHDSGLDFGGLLGCVGSNTDFVSRLLLHLPIFHLNCLYFLMLLLIVLILFAFPLFRRTFFLFFV